MSNKQHVCGLCMHQEDCESPCAAKLELYRLRKELHKAETKEILQELRELLDLHDCEPADDLKELAESVIEEHRDELGFIKEMEIEIGIVRSFQRKVKDGCLVYADTEKIKHRYSAYLPFDFVIAFYEPNIVMLNDDQRRILMWHELRHIGIGEKGYKVMPHEIEDFFSIVEKHGMRWDEMGSGDWI